MRRPSAAIPLLAAAALLLILLRLVGDRSAPPMYEGLPTEEPYRYLHPLRSQAGLPPDASQTTPVSGGEVGGLSEQTIENPPQALILIGDRALAIPSGASSITTTIRAVDAPQTRPPSGYVAGNVYRIAIVSNAGADVPLRSDHPATVLLRGPLGTADATVERYDGSAWTALRTTPIGEPFVFGANTAVLGDFARS